MMGTHEPAPLSVGGSSGSVSSVEVVGVVQAPIIKAAIRYISVDNLFAFVVENVDICIVCLQYVICTAKIRNIFRLMHGSQDRSAKHWGNSHSVWKILFIFAALYHFSKKRIC
jgi:L-asparagine transporter-like permease